MTTEPRPTLAEFLAARLDETAEADPPHDLACVLVLAAPTDGPCDCGWPARVLREAAAMRAILELHDGAHECSTFDEHGDVDNCTWLDDGRVCSTLKLLAAIFSGHPDYDPQRAPR